MANGGLSARFLRPALRRDTEKGSIHHVEKNCAGFARSPAGRVIRRLPEQAEHQLLGFLHDFQRRLRRKGEASKDPSASSKAEASAKPESSAAPEKTEAADGLGAFREALHGVYGDKYYPDTKLTEDEIREELGLDDTLYEEVYAENTAEKAHPDTFIAVKAKAGKVDEVKEKLTAYKQRLLSDNAFAANTDKIDAAEIYSEGDYVFFVLLGDIDDSTSSEGFAEAFGKEIQRGIDAIKEALGAM